MTTYRIEVYKEVDNGDDASWDAMDWKYMVVDADNDDDIVCICATEGEANHIQQLLVKYPYNASTVTGQ